MGPTPAASAQSVGAIERELNDLADYMAQLKPVMDDMVAILDLSEQSDSSLNGFIEGRLTEALARRQLLATLDEIKLRVNQVRADFKTIGSAPKLTLAPDMKLGVSKKTFEKMLSAVESLALSLADLSLQALDGDEAAVEEVGARVVERTKLLIKISNELTRADLAQISSKTHPQKAILKSSISSNDTALLLMNLELAYYDQPDAVSGLLADLQKQARSHELLIASGKREQSEVLLKMQAALKMAKTDEEVALFSTLVKVISAYDEAWTCEQSFVDAIRVSQKELNSGELNADDASLLIAALLDELVEAETNRADLIFARAAMLKQ